MIKKIEKTQLNEHSPNRRVSLTFVSCKIFSILFRQTLRDYLKTGGVNSMPTPGRSLRKWKRKIF